MEAELGSKLVARGSRPVALTREGALLELQAEPLLRTVSDLPDLLRAAGRTLVRDFRLGFVDTFASAAGPELAATVPLIRYNARSHTGFQVERHLRRLGLTTERWVEVDSSDALLAMVAVAIGWAISTPLCILQASSHLPGIMPLSLPAPSFNRTLSLVLRDDCPSGLVTQLADAALGVLRGTCLPHLRRLNPAFTQAITVGTDYEP